MRILKINKMKLIRFIVKYVNKINLKKKTNHFYQLKKKQIGVLFIKIVEINT